MSVDEALKAFFDACDSLKRATMENWVSNDTLSCEADASLENAKLAAIDSAVDGVGMVYGEIAVSVIFQNRKLVSTSKKKKHPQGVIKDGVCVHER